MVSVKALKRAPASMSKIITGMSAPISSTADGGISKLRYDAKGLLQNITPVLLLRGQAKAERVGQRPCLRKGLACVWGLLLLRGGRLAEGGQPECVVLGRRVGRRAPGLRSKLEASKRRAPTRQPRAETQSFRFCEIFCLDCQDWN